MREGDVTHNTSDGPQVMRDIRKIPHYNKQLRTGTEIVDTQDKPVNQQNAALDDRFQLPGFVKSGSIANASYFNTESTIVEPEGRWTYGAICRLTANNKLELLNDVSAENLTFVKTYPQPGTTTNGSVGNQPYMPGLNPAHFSAMPLYHPCVLFDDTALMPVGIVLTQNTKYRSTLGQDEQGNGLLVRAILAPGVPVVPGGVRSAALEAGPGPDGMSGLVRVSSRASVNNVDSDMYYQLGRGYYNATSPDQAMGFIADANGCNKTAHRNTLGIKGAHIDINSFFYLDATRDGPKAFYEDAFAGVAGTGTVYEVQQVFDQASGLFKWQVKGESEATQSYDVWGFWSWDGTGDKYPPPPPPQPPNPRNNPVKPAKPGEPWEVPEDDPADDPIGDPVEDAPYEPYEPPVPPPYETKDPWAEWTDPDNPGEPDVWFNVNNVIPDNCYAPSVSNNQIYSKIYTDGEQDGAIPNGVLTVTETLAIDDPANPVNWLLPGFDSEEAGTHTAPHVTKASIPTGPKPKTFGELGMPSLHVIARSSAGPSASSGASTDYGGRDVTDSTPYNMDTVTNPGNTDGVITDGNEKISGYYSTDQLKYDSAGTYTKNTLRNAAAEKAEASVFLGYAEQNTDGTLKKQSAEGKGYQVPSTDNNGVFIAPSDVTLQNEDGTTTQKTNVLLHTDRTQLAFGLPSQNGVYDSIFKIETDGVSGLKYLVIDVSNLTGGLKLVGIPNAGTGDSDALFDNGGALNIEP